MQECESHASVHSCAVLVEVFEIPMKSNAANLFSTLILNEDDRYWRKKSSHQDCLYIYWAVNISQWVSTDHCFLQQNKSFGFDLQRNLGAIIGVQNWFEGYAQLNTLIVLYIST